jgi:hypothetical protein
MYFDFADERERGIESVRLVVLLVNVVNVTKTNWCRSHERKKDKTRVSECIPWQSTITIHTHTHTHPVRFYYFIVLP